MGKNITVAPWIYYTSQPPSTSAQVIPVITEKTRLGLVGETLIGPAFQPVLVTNNTEFTNLFGNTSLVVDGITNFPRYELPYIAKSYLNESKALFVTRVLGLSGYDAGYSWSVTLESNFDSTTVGPTVTGGTYPILFNFTADTQDIITNLVSNDSLLQTLWNNNLLTASLSNLPGSITIPTNNNYTAGTLSNVTYKLLKFGSIYSGLSINNFYLNNYDVIPSVGFSGTTSGVTVYYSANTFDGVDDQVVALLKSRANYDADEILNFRLSGGTTSLGFNTTLTAATNYIYNDFELTWTESGNITGSTKVTFDKGKSNYITNILGINNNDKTTPIYVEEIYDNIIRVLDSNNKVKGIKLSLVNYTDKFNNYKDKFKPSVTPWVVSQIKGSNISKLFRIWTKGDGKYTTDLLKITISNIRLANSQHTDYDINNPDKYDDYKFDLSVRPIDNPDTNFISFTDEIFKNCSMNPKSKTYISKMIGTKNGDYPSNSNYIFIEVNEDDENILQSFPAGYLGYPIRDYETTTSGIALSPYNLYKTTYNVNDIIDKTFLGLGDVFGYDKSMFTYKGLPNSNTITDWTGLTKGFHMDIDATGATIDTDKITVDGINYFKPINEFEVGNSNFDDEQNVISTQYEKLNYRKFTLIPYGGFDGWDIYRKGRTNSNNYTLNGNKGILGEINDNFNKITLTDNSVGLSSDYYAFLEGIWTFKNTDFIDINLFATPGLDTINHNDLVEAAIDMVEFNRADSLYIITTPDVDSSRTRLNTQDVVDFLDGKYDTTYAATYFPWTKVNVNGDIWLPPTTSVVTNMAKYDKSTNAVWYATAGVEKGDINVLDIRKYPDDNGLNLTKLDVNYLYNNRINPLIKIDIYQSIITYTGFKIWGNKTLSTTNHLTNRVNVRRLLLEIRYLMINACRGFLFNPNDNKTQRDIENKLNPILASIKDNRGISQFKLKFDTTPEFIDKGHLDGKIFIKPINALEYMVFQFSIIPDDNSLNMVFNQG